jgi:hypothetical protein
MSPSNNQLENLSRMTAILSGNWKASILAHSLWEFFNYQLYCTVRKDDGEPNSYRIDGIENARTVGKIRIAISLRPNHRQEEGLVHELLHLNQIPFGYPTFWINEVQGSDKWALAGGIINNADHVVIEPIYLSFGYSAGRFLGPTRPLTDREKGIVADLRAKAANLATPSGYLSEVSACLRHYNINFKAMHFADVIVNQAGEPADSGGTLHRADQASC